METAEIFIKIIPLNSLEEICERCGIIPLRKIIEEYPSATNYLSSNERNKFIQHYLNQIKFYSLESVNTERQETELSEEDKPITININFICFACKEGVKDEYKRKGFAVNE